MPASGLYGSRAAGMATTRRPRGEGAPPMSPFCPLLAEDDAVGSLLAGGVAAGFVLHALASRMAAMGMRMRRTGGSPLVVRSVVGSP